MENYCKVSMYCYKLHSVRWLNIGEFYPTCNVLLSESLNFDLFYQYNLHYMQDRKIHKHGISNNLDFCPLYCNNSPLWLFYKCFWDEWLWDDPFNFFRQVFKVIYHLVRQHMVFCKIYQINFLYLDHSSSAHRFVLTVTIWSFFPWCNEDIHFLNVDSHMESQYDQVTLKWWSLQRISWIK